MEAPDMSRLKASVMTKKHEIVLFSATAIALYGYDQGMPSNKSIPNMYSVISLRHDVLDQHQL